MQRARHRVLVVEDDPLIQSLVAESLGEEGFEVRCLSNGRDALGVLDSWTPDLILLDMTMPIMDGATFRAAQRLHPTARRVPVVIMTARTNIDQLREQLQAAALLPKPFGIDYLLATVNSALQ